MVAAIVYHSKWKTKLLKNTVRTIEPKIQYSILIKNAIGYKNYFSIIHINSKTSSKMNKKGSIFYIIWTALVTVLFITSCASRIWMEIMSDDRFTFVKVGLWKKCGTPYDNGFNSKCISNDKEHVPAWFWAVRLFIIFAVLFSGGAVVLAVLTLFTEKVNLNHVVITLTYSGVCGAISTFTMLVKYRDFFPRVSHAFSTFELGHGLIVGIAATLCTIPSLLVSFYIHRPKSTTIPPTKSTPTAPPTAPSTAPPTASSTVPSTSPPTGPIQTDIHNSCV